jgi:SAM-dependent MidA family methyltransferase
VTPLGIALTAEIRAAGPIGVDRFMAAAAEEYYHNRDPFGRAGDFVTAPEISQVFGEIIGAWLADQWRIMGAPPEAALVELGPGRGTLMADALRAMRPQPGCLAAIRLHLVETSPVLRERQRDTIGRHHPNVVPDWHETIEAVPRMPLLLVANEFFDALPVRQWLFRDGRWHERLIGFDPAGGFTFVVGPARLPPFVPPEPPEGAIFETCEPALDIARAIGGRLAECPGAALVIDYGHAKTVQGETLQAMRGHRPVPVLDGPGEADLTAHVDFEALSAALAEAGAAVAAPVPQGRFLVEHGARLRALALARGKPESVAAGLLQGVERLVDPRQMGTLFKVLAATSRGPALPPQA